MENRELQAYLEAFRSEGEFDSEGFFTLDKQKAVGKLARYLLPDDGSWILKVVQAACRFDAALLKVKVVKAYTSLRLDLPRRLPHGSFREALLGGRPEQAGTEFLCSGLRAAAHAGAGLVTLSVIDPEATTTFLVNNGQISESTGPGAVSDLTTGSRIQVLVQRVRETKEGVFERGDAALRFAKEYLQGVQSDDYLSLLHRARCCSVPLLLNGSRIDDLALPWLTDGKTRTHFVGAVFGQSHQPEENTLVIPSGLSRRHRVEGALNSNHGPLACLRFDRGERARCLLGVHYYTKRLHEGTVKSRLHFVKDGVLVDSAVSGFSSTVGFDLVLAPAELRTDITGLKANIAAAAVANYPRYIRPFRGPLKKLALYLTGPSFYVRRYHAPVEFEGLDLYSKLWMFAAGRLKVRRDAGLSLEWALSRPPFTVPVVSVPP